MAFRFNPFKNVFDVIRSFSELDARYYTQSQVDALIGAENLWDRSDSTLTPHTANDSINIGSGDLTTTGIGTFGTLIVDTPTLVVNVSGYTDKVGIGTATPTRKLEIIDTAEYQFRIARDASDYADFNVNSEGNLWISPVGGQTFFYRGSNAQSISIYNAVPTTTIHLNSAGDSYFNGGQLGIGVIDPDTRLEVLYAGTQLKLSYDASNYFTFAVQSDGDLTLDSNKASYDLNFGDGNLITSGIITAGGLTLSSAGNISGLKKHLRFTIIDPNTVYAKDTQVCVVAKLDAAITITNLEVTCDADPATEITGDLKYADAFIGLANAVVINDFDTTAGARSDSSITSGSVASGKCIYIQFDVAPIAAITQIVFDLTYDYD